MSRKIKAVVSAATMVAIVVFRRIESICKPESVEVPQAWIDNVVDMSDVVEHLGFHPCCSINRGQRQKKMFCHPVHGFIGLESYSRWLEFLGTETTDQLRQRDIRLKCITTTAGHIVAGLTTLAFQIAKNQADPARGLTKEDFRLWCKRSYRSADYERITGEKIDS